MTTLQATTTMTEVHSSPAGETAAESLIARFHGPNGIVSLEWNGTHIVVTSAPSAEAEGYRFRPCPGAMDRNGVFSPERALIELLKEWDQMVCEMGVDGIVEEEDPLGAVLLAGAAIEPAAGRWGPEHRAELQRLAAALASTTGSPIEIWWPGAPGTKTMGRRQRGTRPGS